MQNLSRSLKVGVMLIIATVSAVVLWRVLFGQSGSRNGRRLYALFDDATGLVPRSRVSTAGIAVGEIESIRLQNGRARVTIRVNSDVPVYDNATVARRASSLLGEFLLVMTPGTADHQRLPEGGRITTVMEGATTDQIMTSVARITANLGEVSARMNEAFGSHEGGREMREILRNIRDLTAGVNQIVQSNSEVVSHTLQNVNRITSENATDIRATMTNLRDSTDRLAQILGRGQPQDANSVTELRGAIANVSQASRDLRETLAHANSTAARVDRGEGTVGRLLHDEALIDEVQGTAEALNDVIAPIARLQTIVGLRSEYNFIANSLRSTVEVRLQPREDKYYLLELVDDPRGLTRNISTVTDTTDPTQTAHVRTVQRVTTDAFRLSVMFARRLGPATFRFGIKESTGGVGMDLHLLDNRLEIRTDLFAFGENTYPRLRVAAALNILQRAWIIGGVDDVFNGDRFDYFLGAQLRFNDQDLKSILPFASGLGG